MTDGAPLRSRILIADDDEDIRQLVAIRLEAAGYDVIEARDGDEVLELAYAHEPDLLLLDVGMPERNGLQVCRDLQQAIALPPPVIFLTAQGHTTARVEGLESGAVDYVLKPFDPVELVARVRAALRAKASRDALVAAAGTDSLTGVLNRGGLDARAEEAIAVASRYKRPLACVMVDLDNFKEINDTFGHPAGDAVLRGAATRLVALARRPDIVGRYGGDEFVLLLPETAADGAARMGERVAAAIAERPVVALDDGVSVELTATASVGVASREPTMHTPDEFYAAADRALYEAKRLGRARVAVAPDSPAGPPGTVSSRNGAGRTILIVEDDQEIAQLMAVRLRAEGYELAFARDAVTATAVARQVQPDMVLLDIGLPGGDGFLVIERLRKLASLALVPIIVVSAPDPVATDAEARVAGATAFFSKPLDLRALLSAIRSAFARSAAA